MLRRPLLLLPLALAACASPDPDLYTLVAIPGTPVPTGPRRVELRRIGLAGYLDRPEILRASANYRLDLARNDRWGEPLGRMSERVLTENLVQRLPDAAVSSEAGAISTTPDVIIEIDIQRFDADSSGTVTLLAQVALRREGGQRPQAQAGTLRFTAPVSGAGTTGLVAAMSTTLAALADSIARMVAQR
ncbi:Membrane integrity-associated transporter subunit PqiC [Rhodovastum atsumiense]|uniref:Membrane integrity-associated transporter subunit PqiC n=1 Tax=Rhodovastum atsumiense TaxID=504468 RepID=A0A5M6IVF9_9PROT|nr:PqiC family protein [Rhodovastum atsumiense]KAA5612294.1 membrane integrity-associated transporter subunit PqiC [Rhodovastum atsumiense]CAH2601624.1 Membrane integrity-associated transporter subunit PqiC [Rhodovastum atsumiense]